MSSNRQWLVVGNEGDVRVLGFQRALRKAGYPRAIVASYREVLEQQVDWSDADALRIEAPGRDFETEQLLIEAGGGARIQFDKGRIHDPAHWYLGLCRVMGLIPPCPAMNTAADVMTMFDKAACSSILCRGGVAMPAWYGRVSSFDDVRKATGDTGSAFIKLENGSSASGAVAYRTSRGRYWAATTVEQANGRLYNSRRVRILTSEKEIAALIDALGPYGMYAERWMPKAGMDGRTFDVRVLVIRGKASQVAGRLSRSPMTNLHLLNDRASAERVAAHVGEEAWSRILAEAEAAAACFPNSHYAGIDVLITPDFRTVKVLEINAFGDLLPGVFDSQGRDTYESELAAWMW